MQNILLKAKEVAGEMAVPSAPKAAFCSEGCLLKGS